LYFSGYEVTMLTQGNKQTAQIYAGSEEIKAMKERKEIIKNAWFKSEDKIAFGQVTSKSQIMSDQWWEDRMPIAKTPGVLYKALKKLKGVKLEYISNIPGVGLNNKTIGGYRVVLDNYVHKAPLLFSLKEKAVSGVNLTDLGVTQEQYDNLTVKEKEAIKKCN